MKQRGDDHKAAVEDVPVVLECAVNEAGKNPYEPTTVEEHITELIKVLDAGVAIAHNRSNEFHDDPQKAARFYEEVYRPVRNERPHAVLYPTVNLDVLCARGRAAGLGWALR